MQKPVKIRRMAGSTNNLFFGVVYLLAAAVFIVASVWMLADGNREGTLTLLLALVFAAGSLNWVLPYFQQIILMETAVQVYLGPLKLQEMPAEEIHALLYATVIINLGRRPETYRELTEVPVLVLSTRSSAYLKMMYRRFAEKVHDQSFANEQEKEYFILHYAIDTHIGNSGRNLRLPKEEGVWMEYTPERFAILRQLYPEAEDCTE